LDPYASKWVIRSIVNKTMGNGIAWAKKMSGPAD
jgi:hypothetical protein